MCKFYHAVTVAKLGA